MSLDVAATLLNVHEDAETLLHSCCGSRKWAMLVANARPFKSGRHLAQVCSQVWHELCSAQDYLEAASAHPQIGSRPDARSSVEQARILESGTDTLHAQLLELNRRYEEKFGFVFLICATNKTMGEVLAALRSRILRDRDEEIEEAAKQQAAITLLRLAKLGAEDSQNKIEARGRL